ncbi:MAG: glycosyltransferase [Candidatus Aminicenantes bacterium]|nr:glycosyltransferase [Candidatus Aminicenantes bacterium]
MEEKKEYPQISLVIPFFNEEENIEELYQGLVKVLTELNKTYEMIFIDDGSLDNTYQILTRLYQKDENIRVIKLKKNFGQTAALQAGFDVAQGEIIISMDGDLQHDPQDIPRLLSKLEEGYDIVSGWRKERKDHLLFRRLPSMVANRIMRFLSGVKIHDFGTTFKAYQKKAIKGIQLYGELHRFIPALISRTGVRIAEVPIKNIVRKKGKSKYSLSRIRRVLFDLLTVKFIISFIDRPLQLFGLVGLGFGGIGFTIALILTIGFYFFSWSIRDNIGNLVLAVFLMILGFQFIMTGLLAEIISRIYFVTHRTKIYTIEEMKSRRQVEEEKKE